MAVVGILGIATTWPWYRLPRFSPGFAGRRDGEVAVFSCNYNGWADAPEEEREALDTYEAGVAEAEGASAPGHVALTLPINSPASSLALPIARQAA